MPTMLERLTEAQNAHDAERLASMFAADYRSAQPAHPHRVFTGSSQVLANWTSMFEGIPDFVGRVVASCVDGEVEWGELDWSGTHADGSPFAMRGVTILTIRDDLIAEGRLYMEPVELDGAAIDAVVRDLSRTDSSS
jgi:hypothetical protein